MAAETRVESPKTRSSLRQRILALVGGLIVLSLLGSTISLYRITEMNRLLEAINRVSVPLGRIFTQIQSDSDLYRRELERGLGSSHWRDSHWRPRRVPRWISDVLESEVTRVGELVGTDLDWAAPDSRARWQEWAGEVAQGLRALKRQEAELHSALERRDWNAAETSHARWTSAMEEWRRQIQWGALEYERLFHSTFSLAQSRVSELRTGLEMILVVVVALSLLLLWFGERALRPLGELTRVAREITRRGLRKEDKALLPTASLGRSDEVSQLAREFHNMATALLEREKTVETQKRHLLEQNRLLREMGSLNENILDSIQSILIVTDLEGRIAQVNPVAARWLEAQPDKIIGSPLSQWEKLAPLLSGIRQGRIEATVVGERTYGGQLFRLRAESPAEKAGVEVAVSEGAGTSERGAILVLEDLTEELDLQERLRRAENLAAIGRLSAQVAHEVRNPLHSIGLEAEVATELAGRLGSPPLKQSLQSILMSVDRLEKITENYLKLSKLSSDRKAPVDLAETLESVLATYASVCEKQGVRVDWKLESGSSFRVLGDRDLLEQVLGNLLRNALQALEGRPGIEEAFKEAPEEPRIAWAMGSAESGSVWLRIEDNGPGIPEELRPRLFTPFVTTRAQGTGLGLSFVKKVLEDHGGAIRCCEREREPGRGAVFELTIPALSAEAELPASVVSGELNA
ncbi:MAG: ATP-binding protein [Oligoflexia bacterium]|nr:ATP-binding protein [Oligoflexia bacterium]